MPSKAPTAPLTWTTIQAKLSDLIEWEKNPVKISDEDALELSKSLNKFNHVLPYVAAGPREKNGIPLLDGHQRKIVEIQVNKTDTSTLVDVRMPSRKLTEKEREEIVIRLRKNTGAFDEEMLKEFFEADDLIEWGFKSDELLEIGFEPGDFSTSSGGGDSSGGSGAGDSKGPSLLDRFGEPPFSILDARSGRWQARKSLWLGLGIQSEIGRGAGVHDYSEAATIHRSNSTVGADGAKALRNRKKEDRGLLDLSKQVRGHYKTNAAPGGNPRPAMRIKDGKTSRGDGKGRKIETASLKGGLTHGVTIHPYDGGESENTQSGTSIFDPVLCELVYRWFCPEGGSILDPFAGGSVRGIVASKTGRPYTGIDLRPEQVAANRKQAKDIVPDKLPAWIIGDAAAELPKLSKKFDLLFSCPPYHDLEKYSDNPLDLSNMSDYERFLTAYRQIVQKAVKNLAENRFAVFVVGDIRDRKGFYKDFVSETISAFQLAGMHLYNEAILITQAGSLPIRVSRQFQSGRKLGKTHQNVLIFYRGDPKQIQKIYGDVEAGEIEGLESEANNETASN